MKTPGKKSVNIDELIHKQISLESVETGKDIYVLIREAWALYQREKSKLSDENLTLVAKLVAMFQDPDIPEEELAAVKRNINAYQPNYTAKRAPDAHTRGHRKAI